MMNVSNLYLGNIKSYDKKSYNLEKLIIDNAVSLFISKSTKILKKTSLYVRIFQYKYKFI